jgi:hypothetical protein
MLNDKENAVLCHREINNIIIIGQITNGLWNTIVSTLSTNPSAERMRRHRQRRRDWMRCLQLEIRDTEIDELIRRKLLKQEMRNDKQSLLDAFYEFLEESLDAAA